ncbi:MAG: ACT domain-containing protein [Pseudomonadota bacterium]
MAERNLSRLLEKLAVYRHPGVWAYREGRGNEDAVFTFRERDGDSHIAPAGPDAALDNRWVWLELTVYSDLNAVGFLAAVATALAAEGVPCNAIAALHHDHIFVPDSLAARAIEAIEALAGTQ